MNQKCKNCGNVDGINFNVSDNLWQLVIPKKIQNKVVCLHCFDKFANNKSIDYRKSIQIIYFAGIKFGFKFRKTK